jgi:hypothetical protein
MNASRDATSRKDPERDGDDLRNSVPIRPSEDRKDEEETDPSRSEEAIS